MYKMYFIRSNKEKIELGNINTKKETSNLINNYIEKCNENRRNPFIIYYTRIWEEKDGIVFDVGSHTEFFFIEGITLKQYNELN